MRQIFLITILLSALSVVAAGQGAHYTYPFSLECPEALISPGDTVSVTANFEGGYTGDRYRPTYNWTTSAGTIVSGQGTAKIDVIIDPEQLSDVHINLHRTFLEAHFPGVQREASCTISIVPTPVPRMTDEFRTRGDNCEEGFARLDQFFVELNNNPTDRGVIVLYGDLTSARAASRREQQLLNHLTFRKFQRDRLEFVRGAARKDGTTQFWLVPPGASDPEVERATDPTEKIPTEPFMYAADYIDGVPGCSGYIFDVPKYAEILRSLSGSRGRIVISESSRAKYNRRLNEILTELSANGITRARITAIYKYVRPNRALESAELWVIPARGR